jgi:hypothetical protein
MQPKRIRGVQITVWTAFRGTSEGELNVLCVSPAAFQEVVANGFSEFAFLVNYLKGSPNEIDIVADDEITAFWDTVRTSLSYMLNWPGH